jgi:carboxyl-terminal processing protease
MTKYSKIILSSTSIVVLTVVFLAGIYIGYGNGPEINKITSLVNKNSEVASSDAVDFNSFWKVWNLINYKYVSTDGPDSQEKVWGAISGLVGSLDDPYSVFFPPEEAKIFESDISGEFQGVGMEIGIRNNTLVVIAPLKGTPAEKSGILPGDKIIKIDDTISSDMPIGEAVRLIRGPVGEDVTLTIIRDKEEKPINIKITRGVIAIPTIDTKVIESTGSSTGVENNNTNITQKNNSDVFVISLYNFSANSANLFRESLRKFVLSGKTKLIIDLRGNPGGYLESSVDIASWFLPAGKIIVQEDFGSRGKGKVYRSKGYDIFKDNLKMAILVNGGSASASEILAGALQEHGKAILVGTQTFGKGSVQELVKITDKASLKITVAKWLTPNGVSISKAGLTPNVVVEVTKKDIESGNDPQLNKAIELLSN